MRSSDDTIPVTCSGCCAGFRVRIAVAGKRIRCPKCGDVISVPSDPGNTEARLTDNDHNRSGRTHPKTSEPPHSRTHPPRNSFPTPAKHRRQSAAPFNYLYLFFIPIATILLIGVVHVSRLVLNATPGGVESSNRPADEGKKNVDVSSNLGFEILTHEIKGFTVYVPASHVVKEAMEANKIIWKTDHSDSNVTAILAKVNDYWDPIEQASTREHFDNVKLVAQRRYGYNFAVERGTVNKQTWIISSYQVPHKTHGTFQELDLYISRNGEHLHVIVKTSCKVGSTTYKEIMSCFRLMAVHEGT